LGHERNYGLLLKATPFAIYKRGGFGDWSQWIELFGMPQRIGKYNTYDPESRSGSGTEASMRKVKGTLHWVEASTAVDIESRLYDYLLKEDSDGKDFLGDFNHDSLQVFHSKGEACLANTVPGDHFQFLRQGYFVTDKDSTPNHIVMNRIVGLRDSWAKAQKK